MVSADDLAGVWRLVSFDGVDAAGRRLEGPLGPAPRGILIYSPDGHMSVSMMRTSAEPPEPDRQYEHFMGYAGTWRLRGSRVIHTVYASAHTHHVDAEQVRDVVLDGDRLSLHGTRLFNGRPQSRVLTWERVNGTGSDRQGEPMKALVSQSYGPIDQLEVAEVPVPAPGRGQVLIRVRAAAVNPLDVRIATGQMREIFDVPLPFVLGLDAAGTVESVGEGVTEFAPGDEVVAFTHQASGAIAEYALANVGPGTVPRPEGVDATTGAALPVAAMTAAGLVRDAKLTEGQTVLVVGATGGVGSFAVQLAARAGARVLATATAADADSMRGLGASDTIDYTSGDTAEQVLKLVPGGVDVAIDLVNAGPGLAATGAAVKAGGLIVSPLGGPPALTNDVTVTYGHIEASEGLLSELVGLVDSGQLTVPVGSTYALADAPAAVADFVAKHTRGKIVITV